jgi:hypothetical protein
MPNATLNNNVINLVVDSKQGDLNLDMSLQRHHYRYCANAGASQANSLLYASVTDQEVLTDATEVGAQMERLLNNDHRPQVLFGVQFKCKSGRVYLVDNTSLNPRGFPNHFFPTSGTALWAQMSQNSFAAACAIRRVEEAINDRPASSRTDFLNGKRLHEIQKEAGIANPVIAAYTAARSALQAVPQDDPKLAGLSGRADIVGLARSF